MKEDSQFQYYLVAFIDVLGQKAAFKEIQGLPRTPEDKSRLAKALNKTIKFLEFYRGGIKKFFDNFAQPTEIAKEIPVDKKYLFDEIRKSEIKFNGFSDFIQLFVSLRTETHFCNAMNGVFAAMSAAGVMSLIALAAKHAVRGGIDVGTGIEWTDGEIYGPALNSAYLLESRKAQYPRILVGEGLLNFLKFQNEQPESIYSNYCKSIARLCEGMIFKDTDGLLALDYLGQGFRRAFADVPTDDTPKSEEVLDDLIKKAQKFIREELERWQQKENKKLANRYRLLQDYFDARLKKVKK